MKALKEYTARANGTRSTEEAISELQREIDVRRRLYDRWVGEGRLSRVDAHDRLERMLTALSLLVKHTEPGANPELPPIDTKKVLDEDRPY